MNKRVMVISLGGSLIIPEKVDPNFLVNFRNMLRKHYKTHKFVLVCGGGVIARKYISVMNLVTKNKKELALAGIRATRMNARLIMQLFGKEANDTLPTSMEHVKSNLRKNNVVICGALRYSPNSTSDGTSAKLAHFLNSEFINLTNVDGLYTSDPRKNKNAKQIPKISWNKFKKLTDKMTFKAGQSFVLDQEAASIIKTNKIKTYIVGKNIKSLENLLKGKKFKGTIISDEKK